LKAEDEAKVSAALLAQAEAVNKEVEKHARIGAVMVSREPWTIENGMLTPTLKLKRDEVEAKFGERAQQLAQESAETRELKLAWC
jgi:long-chain acyl-CoA synthetase